MAGSLPSRQPSSHGLVFSRTISEYPEGNDGENSELSLEPSLFSKDKTTEEITSSFSEPIFHNFLGLQENDHQVGESEGLDETKSQVHGLEEISLELKVGWASNCITKKRKPIEKYCGLKRMKLLGCPDASLELKLSLDPWVIKKRIETSDIGHLSRLLLAADGVKKHIFPMWDANRIESIKNGVRVSVWDCDTKSEYQLMFKRWPSGSYVLIEKWTKDFVERRGLKKGDEIGLYWDQSNSRFNFTILKRGLNTTYIRF